MFYSEAFCAIAAPACRAPSIRTLAARGLQDLRFLTLPEVEAAGSIQAALEDSRPAVTPQRPEVLD